MSEQIGTVLEAIRLEQETHRAEHQAMMARIEVLDQANRLEHEANRLEHEANRADHAAMMARIEALDQASRQEHEANRAEHKAMMTQLSGLGRELAKLGVEFEQHRNDTKVYADGILGLVQKNESLERADAALDCRVTKLEIRVSSRAQRTRKRK
jgi:chromosome segregation ATPase